MWLVAIVLDTADLVCLSWQFTTHGMGYAKLSRREIWAANFLPTCKKAPPTQSKIRTQGDP